MFKGEIAMMPEDVREYIYNPQIGEYEDKKREGIWADINSAFKNLYLKKEEEIRKTYEELLIKIFHNPKIKNWLKELAKAGALYLGVSTYSELLRRRILKIFSLSHEKVILVEIMNSLYLCAENETYEKLKSLKVSATNLSGKTRPIIGFIPSKGEWPCIKKESNGLLVKVILPRFERLIEQIGKKGRAQDNLKETLKRAKESFNALLNNLKLEKSQNITPEKGELIKVLESEEVFEKVKEMEEMKKVLEDINEICIRIKEEGSLKAKFDSFYNEYINIFNLSGQKLKREDFILGYLFTSVWSHLTRARLYFIPSIDQIGEPSGGIFIISEKNINKKTLYVAQDIINRLLSLILKHEATTILERSNRLAAGAAILVESYAHNIGAHSLANIKNLIGKDKFEEELFFTYLKDKSAFWNAVSRGGILWGGEIKNLWDVFSEFMRNTLLCKSIGKDEGWKDVKFIVKSGNDPWELGKSQDIFENLKLIKEKSSEEISKMLKECPKLRALINCRDALINYNVFLPEGVVGQQALYTIIENILRNVKHLQRPNGCCDKSIPFHIEIKDEGSDFYEISFWIDFPQKDVKSKEELEKHIREKMEKWGILREDKSANMGGLSQNILCSGMLLGYDFLETERQFVEEKNGGKKKLIDFEVIEANNKHCCVVWKIKLWKGENVISWSEYKKKTQGEEAPLGRYRIVTYQDEEEKNELLWKSTFIRCVKKDKNEDFGELYKKWVNEFVPDGRIYPQGLYIRGEGFDIQCFFSNKVNGDCCTEQQTPKFWFFHRSSDTPKDGGWIPIRIRKDGVMAKFQDADVITPEQEHLKSELLEIMGVKMDIFDNRIFGEFENLENNQQELLKKLGVDCYKEEEFEGKKNNLNRKHFLVIHLSLIESLTNKRDSEAIKKFWGDYSCVVSKYDFIIVTTGRGRQWLERFKGENTPDDLKEIGRKLRYTPVENLEKCFERAKDLEPYSPAMGIKYALVKALIGS